MSSVDNIELASNLVGFVSFAFTFFTFLRVFWETILSLLSAPKQMTGYLDNLRMEIHNERSYFRSALRVTRWRSKNSKEYHEDVEPLEVLDFVRNHFLPFKSRSRAPLRP